MTGHLTKGIWGILLAIVACSFFTLFERTSYSSPTVSTLTTRDVDENLFFNLTKRDDYSCGPGNPCHNGACCGVSGYCGYGPTYCGTGCSSNCNAKAECGQYSDPPSKTCPLNTCCSQYGFCGTTSDFCTNKCQSNCVEHPSPPAGAGAGALSKVIGYYEAWSARSTCHKEAPENIALNALTHVNFAFAYIDPSSFEITTMDSATPASLFSDVTNVKEVNPLLKVFVSVGGWTFSDNGTATQAVFGNIASSAGNRQKFANNVLKFLNNYGFDGIDLDWEYPGAPDRGGKPDDTKNYVSLLQSLRSSFDASGRELGLTFTIPSSYWYLKWFDLPNMIKYADWVNLMSYDLHGVWDRNNPIGSIVQGHTNLTEIKLSTELLWRVNVPPEKVVMGFGFYGRSFTLADKSCTKPGCLFTGGAAAGPCSATSGILAYYEIMDLIQQKNLKPVHDETAAVKYIVYDGDQWVSYDDAETFSAKVKWANSVGLGGSLIWASDLDDDKFTAHSGLVGREIVPTIPPDKLKELSSKNTAGNIAGNAGMRCEYGDSCRHVGDCPKPGYRWVGGEKAKCGKLDGQQSYHPICCPVDTAPTCQWRGDGGDCDGQCHEGENSIFNSSWGGTPREKGSGEGKCSRGHKTFCCESSDYDKLIQGCRRTSCSYSQQSCNDDEYVVNTIADNCITGRKKTICCPKPANLYDCNWRGSGLDCVNPDCHADEITIARSESGASNGFGCSWGRQQSLCCKAHPPQSDFDCGNSDVCIDNDDYCGAIEPYDPDTDLAKRAGSKRGGDPREFEIALTLLGLVLHIWSRSYPIQSRLLQGANGSQPPQGTLDLVQGSNCTNGNVVFNSPVNQAKLRKGYETEHPVDLDAIAIFIRHTIAGTLPSGRVATNAAITEGFWNTWWNQHVPALANAGAVGHGLSFDTMEGRIFEAMGSTSNRYPLLLAATDINQVKARCFSLIDPFDKDKVKRKVTDSIKNGSGESAWLNNLRDVIAVFNYLQQTNVHDRFDHVRQTIRSQFAIIHNAVQAAQNENLQAWWTDFENDYFAYVAQRARDWVNEQIQLIRYRYNSANPPPRNLLTVLQALQDLANQLTNIRMP